MKTRTPTSRDLETLVAFLPRLYVEGMTPIKPIKRWVGGTPNRDGVGALARPEYEAVVEEFFRVASGECWSDHDYRPAEAGRMLENDDVIKTADLPRIKTMLTYCVRGERFCDGHWGAMIEDGHVRRLLGRLAELGSKTA